MIHFCTVDGSLIAANRACLVDANRWVTFVDTAVDGVVVDGQSNNVNRAFTDGFDVGRMLNLTGKFKGDIAEVRVYNRVLKQVEREIVANHLAARYGVALNGMQLYGGATNGCVFDVVGIGCRTAASAPGGVTTEVEGVAQHRVRVAGTFGTSACSAGLTLAAGAALADGDFVLAGHNTEANAWIGAGTGRKRMKRAWHLTRTNAASVPLRLDFDLAAAGVAALPAAERPTYRLLAWREGVWTEVGEPQGGYTFRLDAASFAETLYTLGADVSARGTLLLVR